MKGRTFILTTGVFFALVVPAAQAANSANRLYQTRVHTILAEKRSHKVAKTDARFYQTQVHTILAA